MTMIRELGSFISSASTLDIKTNKALALRSAALSPARLTLSLPRAGLQMKLILALDGLPLSTLTHVLVIVSRFQARSCAIEMILPTSSLVGADIYSAMNLRRELLTGPGHGPRPPIALLPSTSEVPGRVGRDARLRLIHQNSARLFRRLLLRCGLSFLQLI